MVDDLVNSELNVVPVVLESDRDWRVGKELRRIQEGVLIVDVQIHRQAKDMTILFFHTLSHASIEYNRTDRTGTFLRFDALGWVHFTTTIHDIRP